jgi:plastocyanin
MNAMLSSVVGHGCRAPRRGLARSSVVVAVASLLLAVLLLGCGGCSGSDPAAAGGSSSASAGATDESAAAKPEAVPVDPATVGRIEGVVRVEGEVPEPRTFAPTAEPFCMEHSGGKLTDRSLVVSQGGLEAAFVWIPQGLDGFVFPEATGVVAIDQEGCLFKQRTVGVRVGQDIELRNSDPVLHNINFKGRANKQFNYAIPAGGEPRTTSVRKPEEAVPLVCDVHPWMYASVFVVDHPCFAVAGEGGRYVIEGVPPGTYTLQAWHEKLGSREVQVTVEPSGSVTAPEIVFTMS